MTTNKIIKSLNEKSLDFQFWYYILKNSPTTEWKQPLHAFISTLLKAKQNKQSLSPKNVKLCIYFMHNLAIYIYAKSFGKQLIKGKSIKEEMKDATISAKQGRIYEPNIKITKQFKQKLNGKIPKQCRWGFCAIIEYVSPFNTIERDTKLNQTKKHLKNAVVEQLIPTHWKLDPMTEKIYDAPDRWNNQRIKKTLHTIGNFVLIEESIHKNTSNITKGNFLTDRKKVKNGYKNSIFGELVFLCLEHTPSSDEIPFLYSRNTYKQERNIENLIMFFENWDGVVLH
jgi:uncharacterized phage-associated protein